MKTTDSPIGNNHSHFNHHATTGGKYYKNSMDKKDKMKSHQVIRKNGRTSPHIGGSSFTQPRNKFTSLNDTNMGTQSNGFGSQSLMNHNEKNAYYGERVQELNLGEDSPIYETKCERAKILINVAKFYLRLLNYDKGLKVIQQAFDMIT